MGKGEQGKGAYSSPCFCWDNIAIFSGLKPFTRAIVLGGVGDLGNVENHGTIVISTNCLGHWAASET